MTEGDNQLNEGASLDPKTSGMNDPVEMDIISNEAEMSAEPADAQEEQGIMEELSWLGRGFFQPLYSLPFYRAAARKSLIDAFLFFVAFGTLLSIISTVNLTRNLGNAADDIERAFASGDFPEIVIANGLATVKARQPLILMEGEGSVFILDTTGVYQSIDTGRYFQGFLLTRNSLHVYSNGDYQVLQLADLNSAFGNPIVISRETALDFWRSFTSIFSVVAFIGLGVWNLAIRFMWLTFLGVLVWGVLSAFNTRSDYGPVLTLGVYALVPAVYLTFLLGLVGISFCGFQTGLLLVIWIVVARMALKPSSASERRRLVPEP